MYQILVIIVGFFLLMACEVPSQRFDYLHIVSYNVKNLFDAERDGSEYSQFIPGKNWNLHYYQERKAMFVRFLREIDADIIAFQEIEDDTVIKDLQESLEGYPGIAYSDAEGRAIQVGLLSRFPIREVRTHLLSDVPGGRPILEVHFSFFRRPLIVFVNHWKSKRGGAEVTEAIRIRSAKLLSMLARDILHQRPDTAIIAMGDFNTSPFEHASYPVAISPLSQGGTVTGNLQELRDRPDIVWFSPWLFERVSPGGSYWYRDHWEAIDGFLLTQNAAQSEWMQFVRFQVVENQYLLNKEGKPQGWSRFRSGYSDHLPILLTLRWSILDK